MVALGRVRMESVGRAKDLTSLQPGWFLDGHTSSSWSENWRGRVAVHGPESQGMKPAAGSFLFAVPAQPPLPPSSPAAMAARIARLTLFSGPQCSLCEVGIVQHLSMSNNDGRNCPDCQGRTSQSEETGAHAARICSALENSSKAPSESSTWKSSISREKARKGGRRNTCTGYPPCTSTGRR